uniref:ORF3 n=1 Tax=Giant panda anellovirus TaxID=2016460 RepID=A0A220IGJ8_9VIRU|nr:ORF3 [Giant panda anellovirus]
MKRGSSKRVLWQELLQCRLSEEAWWRSSPNLYSTDGSESESPGGTKRKILAPETPTPIKKKINISGVWPNASDSDWSESSGGGGGGSNPTPPPPTHQRTNKT